MSVALLTNMFTHYEISKIVFMPHRAFPMIGFLKVTGSYTYNGLSFRLLLGGIHVSVLFNNYSFSSKLVFWKIGIS